MKIICPNCNAEYEVQKIFDNEKGQHVRCYNCNQEWYEYNFLERRKNNNSDKNNLKKLAFEEYKILKTSGTQANETKRTPDVDSGIIARIQESSEKLAETKQLVHNKPKKTSAKAPWAHTWTVIGFLAISIIYGAFASLYLFNYEFQKMFPAFKNILLDYDLFIEQLIGLIQSLIVMP